MNNFIEREIHANQGNAGESAVATILSRKGFTCNPSLRDRWGWDYFLEHSAPPAGGEKKKFEGLLQVKSTRVTKKGTVQIKLSALLRLIYSNSVGLIAFVKFDTKSDFPNEMWFCHVGKALIRGAHEASLIAAENGTGTHKAWVSINHSNWLKVTSENSQEINIYAKFNEYSLEFGDNYSAGKRAFFRSLNPIFKGENVPIEKLIGKARLLFSHRSFSPIVYKTSAYMACIGPRFYYRLRSPFCEIEIDGNNIEFRITLNVDRPLSELDTVLSMMDIMETDGWSLEISGALLRRNEIFLKSDFRDEHMKQVSEIIHIYMKAFINSGIQDYHVHFFNIGGQLYMAPDLFRVIKSGGALKAAHNIEPNGRTIMLNMTHKYNEFMIVMWWEFRIMEEGFVRKGNLVTVSPGSLFRADVYDPTKKYGSGNEFGAGGITYDFAENIYVKSVDVMPLPSVRPFADPETIGAF